MPVNRQSLPKDILTGNFMVEIKGLQKTTLLDYPGKVACIVFLAGCNFRCPFCHNSDLVLRADKLPTISEEEFFNFLKSRKGKLEGVVITGGEPTLQTDLPDFIRKIKNLGFLVKLDTNGTNPEMVKKLINDSLIDYVALDFKGPLAKYNQYIGESTVYSLQSTIDKMINILIRSKIDFELRTTVVPTLHTKEDLIEMAKEIKSLQSRWFLQPFSPKKCLDPEFEKIKPYPKNFFERVLPALKKLVPEVEVRGE